MSSSDSKGKVTIVTDTLTEMPIEMAEEYGITLMPMLVTLNGTSYPETEVDKDWYYGQVAQWKASGHMPLTSSIPTGMCLETFRQLSEAGAENILYIGHSSKFGMSVKSARQAARLLEEELTGTRIEVVDTCTVCGAHMLITLEAARASGAGRSLGEIVKLAEGLVRKVSYVILIDDLSILAKGGRIHKARSWADSAITNTSLLEASYATGGQMTPLARCKTRPQAISKLFDIIAERSGGHRLHVALNYTKSADEILELKDLVSQRFDCAEIFFTTLYPLVVNHVGLEPSHISWWSEE